MHFGNAVGGMLGVVGHRKRASPLSRLKPLRCAALRFASLRVEKVDTRLSDRSAFSREGPDA